MQNKRAYFYYTMATIEVNNIFARELRFAVAETRERASFCSEFGIRNKGRRPHRFFIKITRQQGTGVYGVGYLSAKRLRTMSTRPLVVSKSACIRNSSLPPHHARERARERSACNI